MVGRHELGSVLRGWRERLPPAAAGLSDTGGQRRAPGLRREELASLACVSPDYIKRLERGYCTPGQIMSAVALLAEGHGGSDEEIREWMPGNLCRCGACNGILAAIRAVRDSAGRSAGGTGA